MLLIGRKKFFVIRKVKNAVSWTYIISDLNDEKIVGALYKKELQKTNKKDLRIEKVVKKNRNKLCTKWKGYGDSFNSWIDKKDIVWNESILP